MKVIRCKRCSEPCVVKVTTKGTVSSCHGAGIFITEEPLNNSSSFAEKAERIGKIAALIILAGAFCMIAWMLYLVFASPVDRPPSKFRRISIERSLNNMDIRPESVEIHPDGRLYYVLNGKRYEIKE